MQVTRRTFATGIAATAALPAVGTLAQSTPAATPVASDVESRLLALMEEMGVPGAVIGMTSPDSPEPIIMELGVANLETQEPISRDMHFRIASVTKTFVSTVVLQLVDEGLLTLDSTIAEILPDLQVANADVITVRNLLSMRSGLPQLTDNPEYTEEFLLDPTRSVSFGDYAPMMADVPAHADPDTAFEYNNFNYNILGEMIEVLTGESWDANVQARITEPAGMANTSMRTTPEMPAPFAPGYGYLDQDVPEELAASTPTAADAELMATPVAAGATPEWSMEPVNDAGAYDLTAFNPTIAGAAGGLISTIGDLLLWTNELGGCNLISQEACTAMTDTIPMDESGTVSYGLGLIDLGGIYGHNGAINGYQSAIITAPRFGITIAVLTNAHPTIGFGDAAFGLAGVLMS